MLDRKDMHGYQDNSVDHIIDNPHAGLFLDMGLGKTVSTLTAIEYLLYQELEISNCLVIAPKRVAESVWDTEIAKWQHLKHLTISKITGTAKQREKALNTPADIHIIGRDNVVWLCGQFGGSMLPWDMLVIDESSSFKNHQSKRFKALKMTQASFNRVVILTGTPAPNSLIDLWPQIFLLDRGERLGRTITDYRRVYFTNVSQDSNYRVYQVRGKNYEKNIHKQISDICMSMKAKDYLNLPERIDNYIELEFPDKFLKQYNDFEKELVLELFDEETEISVVNAAALTNKLLQFSNGAVYDEHKNFHEIHDLKLDALEEIIEGANGKPVLVAYSYKHDVERIIRRLKKYNPVKLEKEHHITDWNAGKIQVMIMHPASGGHGLNLQSGGNHLVWFGPTWSLELYMQFNARLHRQGQKFKVFIHHLLIKNTIDMDVIKALKRKSAKQDGLMEAVKARLKKYLKNY